MAMAVPGLDSALQSLEDILIAEHGGDESVIARTRGGTVITFREQVYPGLLYMTTAAKISSQVRVCELALSSHFDNRCPQV